VNKKNGRGDAHDRCVECGAYFVDPYSFVRVDPESTSYLRPSDNYAFTLEIGDEFIFQRRKLSVSLSVRCTELVKPFLEFTLFGMFARELFQQSSQHVSHASTSYDLLVLVLSVQNLRTRIWVNVLNYILHH